MKCSQSGEPLDVDAHPEIDQSTSPANPFQIHCSECGGAIDVTWRANVPVMVPGHERADLPVDVVTDGPVVVWVAWDLTDYYGPDPLAPEFLFRTFEAARQAVEANWEDRRNAFVDRPTWKRYVDDETWEFGPDYQVERHQLSPT